MRIYEIKPHLQDTLKRLRKKDSLSYERVLKKIDEILNTADVEHYKNLRYDLKDRKRVHVGHFVLVFQYFKDEDKIVFLDYAHHEEVYDR